MKNTLAIACYLLVLACLSCRAEPDKILDEAKQRAGEVREKALVAAQDSQKIRSEIERLLAAADRKDLARLKEACEAIDLSLGTRVLAQYYGAFAMEVNEGPAAVIDHLHGEIEKRPEGDRERSALVGLRKYFEAKGTTTTKDALILVLLVALEAKFPHGRGTILLAPFLESPGNKAADAENRQEPR